MGCVRRAEEGKREGLWREGGMSGVGAGSFGGNAECSCGGVACGVRAIDRGRGGEGMGGGVGEGRVDKGLC